MPHTSDMGYHQPVVRLITEVQPGTQFFDESQESCGREEKKTDKCLVEGHEERLKSIDADL